MSGGGGLSMLLTQPALSDAAAIHPTARVPRSITVRTGFRVRVRLASRTVSKRAVARAFRTSLAYTRSSTHTPHADQGATTTRRVVATCAAFRAGMGAAR